MHLNLKQSGLEIKTMRSQLSNLDMFSKLQSNFLQKFFKYNLNDYFSQTFLNVYEDILNKKIKNNNTQSISPNRLQKYVATSMFVASNKFTIEEFQKNMQRFYNQRSTSMQSTQLPFAFKLKYKNSRATPSLIKSGQLIFVDVKLKVDVQKIQEFPQKIIKYLQTYKNVKKNKLTPLEEILAIYREQYFNIFFIYFGDSNFQIFNKQNYQISTIKLMGNTYKLRIHAFYVSKQALIESFKFINKIDNLEYINDLVIQFYELKREKQRRKKIKQNNNITKQGNQLNKEKIYMFIGIFGLVGFGFALKKLFL